MRSLKWSTSHAVFVTEIDDDHNAIFQALSAVRQAIGGAGSPAEISKLLQDLVSRISEHFAHEERLMRAARYGSLRWHKTAHDQARKRVLHFVQRREHGDAAAGVELVEHLSAWLNDHVGVADRMLGAFLRNHDRFMCKVTFRAGTRPVDSCAWVTATGETFDPGSDDI